MHVTPLFVKMSRVHTHTHTEYAFSAHTNTQLLLKSCNSATMTRNILFLGILKLLKTSFATTHYCPQIPLERLRGTRHYISPPKLKLHFSLGRLKRSEDHYQGHLKCERHCSVCPGPSDGPPLGSMCNKD